MLKKVTLEVLAVVGALLTAFSAVSGIALYLFGGRTDPTILWFAPLFFIPAAAVGIGMMLISSLVSRQRRRLFGWSLLVFVTVLVLTAAAFNLTGLASGEIELEGTFWGTAAIVLSVLYSVATLAMSGVGVAVARDIMAMEPHHHAAAPVV
jgi:hypothetical protein